MNLLRQLTILATFAFPLLILTTQSSYCQDHPQIPQLNQKKPPAFEENLGQITDQNGRQRSDIKYIYAKANFKLILKENSFSYELSFLEEDPNLKQNKNSDYLAGPTGKPEIETPATLQIYRVDVDLIGANKHPEIIAENAIPGYSNYYLSHTPEAGITRVRAYQTIIYKNIYPNIDLVFYTQNEEELKYDIIIHPGGRLSDLVMNYEGLDYSVLNEKILFINKNKNWIKEQLPHSYFKETNSEVAIQYSMDGPGRITFASPAQLTSGGTLVIDPVISWGTYYGGSNDDAANDIATGSSGSVFVTGYTRSTSGIATSGAHQNSVAADLDMVIAKFDNTGNRVWGTYYGGSDIDQGTGIVTDDSDNVYISGWTTSDTGIATSGAHQYVHPGFHDAVIAKFDSSGSRIWATYYGGSVEDYAFDIAADDSANLYIGGYGNSNSGIATSGVYQSYKAGDYDGYIIKFSRGGSRVWGTYYGGSKVDDILNLTTDRNGNVYVCGFTFSPLGIASSVSFQTTFGGLFDGFLAKFSGNGNLLWGTYYGGSDGDQAFAVTTDSAGNVYLTGQTESGSGFASTGAYQTSNAGGYDAYAAKFSNVGARLWGTYFGGTNTEYGRCITASDDYLYIIGYTNSSSGIATTAAIQSSLGGNYDIFAARFSTGIGSRQWGTYYGDTADEYALGATADEFGNVYFAGYTHGSSGLATTGAHQTSFAGNTDGIIAVIEHCDTPISSNTIAGSQHVCHGKAPSALTGSTPAGGGGNYAYQWQKSTDSASWLEISGANGKNYSPIAPLQKTYYRRQVITLDCFGSNGTNSNVVVVEIDTLPSGAITPAGSTTFCDGDSVRLEATIASGLTYQWSLDGNEIQGATAASYKANTAGNYTVKITDGNNCEATSAAVPVEVNALPIAMITPSDSVICQGDTVVLMASTQAGNSYKWLHNGADVMSTDSFYAATQSGAFNVVVTSDKGCPDSSNSINITVNALPPAIVTPTPQANICQGDTIALKAKTGMHLFYSWIKNQSLIPNAEDSFYMVTMAGDYAVHTLDTATGCENSSATTTVDANPLPDTMLAASGSLTFCDGDSIILSAAAMLGYSYQWKKDGADIPGAVSPDFIAITTGDYQVLITNSFNCKSTSHIISVLTNENPKSDFSFMDICFNSETFFNNQSLISTASHLSYSWNFGDNTTSVEESPRHKFNSPGKYTVELVAVSAEGCIGMITKEITVFPLPNSNFTSSHLGFKRISFIPTEMNAAAYDWQFGDGSSSTATSPVHTYAANGTYSATLTIHSTDGCESLSTKKVPVNSVGINNFNNQTLNINIYPNPFSENINITFSISKSSTANIEIFNLNGKLIKSIDAWEKAADEHHFEIAANGLPDGVYIVRIVVDDEVFVRRILREK